MLIIWLYVNEWLPFRDLAIFSGLPLNWVILTICLIQSKINCEEKDCLDWYLLLGDPAHCDGAISRASPHAASIISKSPEHRQEQEHAQRGFTLVSTVAAMSQPGVPLCSSLPSLPLPLSKQSLSIFMSSLAVWSPSKFK